jgi:hypothetical protein
MKVPPILLIPILLVSLEGIATPIRLLIARPNKDRVKHGRRKGDSARLAEDKQASAAQRQSWARRADELAALDIDSSTFRNAIANEPLQVRLRVLERLSPLPPQGDHMAEARLLIEAGTARARRKGESSRQRLIKKVMGKDFRWLNSPGSPAPQAKVPDSSLRGLGRALVATPES